MKIKMKTKFYLIALVLICNFTSCKKESTFTDFKFSDKPATLACENINIKLYNEALYSFEEDITNHFGNRSNSTLAAYSQFIRLAISNRVNYEDIVSEHSYNVFNALKENSNLWDLNNSKSHLNYNSDLMRCISNNISDSNIKTTLNALISTNSMSPKLFGAPLTTNYRLALSDKYLASYIAFEFYYAKMLDIDFSQVDFKSVEKKAKTVSNIEINKLK